MYGIVIVPLGGFVKMLGQDDDPAHIAEQMKKSEVSAASAEGVEVVGPKGEKYYVDRRSYLAKSVPQRMAIISAGVVSLLHACSCIVRTDLIVWTSSRLSE